MATDSETLRALEARAERAITQELRLMVQEIVSVQPQLALDDRAHTDALLLKLGRLHQDQVAAAPGPAVAPAQMPTLRPDAPMPGLTPAYKVFFYDREYGDLTDAVTTDSFDAGVQLVRDRLPLQADYVVEATWTRGLGEMEVRSPRGTVVARVQPVGDTDVTVQPPVIKACTALQVGNATPLEQLFTPMPEAA